MEDLLNLKTTEERNTSVHAKTKGLRHHWRPGTKYTTANVTNKTLESSSIKPHETAKITKCYGSIERVEKDRTKLTYTESACTAMGNVVEKTNCGDQDSTSMSKSRMKFRNLSKTQKLTLILLCCGAFAHMSAFSLIAPFFPKEATEKDVSPTVIGLIFSTFMLMVLLSSPVYGSKLTTIGARFMLVAGLGVGGVCAILFGILEYCPPGVPFIVLCFCTRLIQALGFSAFITANFAIAANEFPDNIAIVYGFLETAASFGCMVGPLAGSFFYSVGGFGFPFYMSGSFILLCTLLILTYLPSQIVDSQPQTTGSFFPLYRSGLVNITVLSIWMCSFSNGFIDFILALHVEKAGLATQYVGLVFIAWSVMYATTAPVWGWICDKMDIPSSPVIIGNVMCSLSFLLLGPSSLLPFVPCKVWVIVTSLALNSIGLGWVLIPSMKLLLRGARNLRYEENLATSGLISGLFQCSFSCGAFMGPTVGSILVEHYRIETTSTFIAVSFLLVALVTFIFFFFCRERFS